MFNSDDKYLIQAAFTQLFLFHIECVRNLDKIKLMEKTEILLWVWIN